MADHFLDRPRVRRVLDVPGRLGHRPQDGQHLVELGREDADDVLLGNEVDVLRVVGSELGRAGARHGDSGMGFGQA